MILTCMKMIAMTSRILPALVAIACGLSTAGCVYTNEISRTKHDIETHTATELDRGIVLSLGPSLFHTAGWLTGFINESDVRMAGRAVNGIRRIKAGVYPVTYLPEIEELDIPDFDRFKQKGWEVALKVEYHNEVGWLLYRERRRRVRDLFVISLSENELVLARIQGNLDELLNIALVETEDDWNSFGTWADH